jgi:L-rhamnonate dehydratase
MKIERVHVEHLGESLWGHLGKREESLPLVTPLAMYPRYRHPITTWFWDSAVAMVRIETDEGVSGIGWCEDGCGAIKPIIDHHLSRLLIGQNPFEVEGLWDRLFRASIPYGRKGAAIEAISAIDIALWDIIGKALRKPVYELLGGPVRESVLLYASGLHPVTADKVSAEASDYVAQGYTAMKLRFAHGPADGIAGMRANEAHVKVVRDAVGDDVQIMMDAYMGWDLPYAISMCERLEQYQIAWLEEPFIPDDLDSYVALRRRTTIPIAGGEHEFTRFGFKHIIERQAMDILQPDLHRCGGITEARKIAALASAAGLQVIPHAYSAPHVHFVVATTNCPMLEYFPLPVWEEKPTESTSLFVGEPTPRDGRVVPSSEPGLGIEVLERAIAC